MYNWSTDASVLKTDTDKYKIWQLEQMVNFGLNGDKIDEAELRKYWSQLALDPARKNFLSILLDVHEKNASHQNTGRVSRKRRS